jgi:hypothetical protein
MNVDPDVDPIYDLLSFEAYMLAPFIAGGMKPRETAEKLHASRMRELQQ